MPETFTFRPTSRLTPLPFLIAFAVLSTACPKDRTKTFPTVDQDPPATELSTPTLGRVDQEVPELPLPVDGEPSTPDELDRWLRERGLLGEIFFAFDRFDLSEKARASLQRDAEYLLDKPHVAVTLEGHCDERGTHEYNLALGELRARTALDYLVALGVKPDRLSTVSYGEDRGVCWQSEESCWSRNRRAYLRVTSTSMR